MSEKTIVVLLSGSGSNLQAFIDAQKNGSLKGQIVAVLSNKADAYGLQRAEQAGIDTLVVEHQHFDSRQAFDKAMMAKIEPYNPDLIILAGFMRILSADFVLAYTGKLLNIHPSLLPKYPGLHTHRKALENNDEFHGTTVHFVTEELDGGPLIAQAKLKLDRNISEDELLKKVQTLEHLLYPKVASWYLEGRLSMREDGVYFDSQKITSPIELPLI